MTEIKRFSGHASDLNVGRPRVTLANKILHSVGVLVLTWQCFGGEAGGRATYEGPNGIFRTLSLLI